MSTFITIFVALLVLVIVAKLIWKFVKMAVVCAVMAGIGFVAVTHGAEIRDAAEQHFPADITHQLEELF